MIELFDSHAHFKDDDESAVLETLARARSAGVTRIMAAGGDAAANRGAAKVKSLAPENVLASAGYDRETIDSPREPIDFSGLSAAGEMGLDYFCDPGSKTRQMDLFIEQLSLAQEHSLPVIIHTRAADDDTLSALREVPSRGVIHCFTGGLPFCRALLDLGFYISISGIVTFKSADNVREAAKYVPDDRILIETDSPFLAPVPMRGNRNEPAFLVHTAKFLAGLRGTGLDVFAAQTVKNTMEAFKA